MGQEQHLPWHADGCKQRRPEWKRESAVWLWTSAQQTSRDPGCYILDVERGQASLQFTLWHTLVARRAASWAGVWGSTQVSSSSSLTSSPLSGLVSRSRRKSSRMASSSVSSSRTFSKW